MKSQKIVVSKQPKIIKVNTVNQEVLSDKLKLAEIVHAKKEKDRTIEKFGVSYKPSKKQRIALIQTGSWGDCINSTLMFKPLKEKFANSTIDVYTSTYHSSAFHNNPFIDNIIKFNANRKETALHLMTLIPNKIMKYGYDMLYNPHPMINPGRWSSEKHPELGENLIYSWVRSLEDQNIKVDLPLETIMELTKEEIKRVDDFCSPVNMDCRNIIMEIHGESGQTFWDHRWTQKVGEYLLDHNTNLFISRKHTGDDIANLKDIARNRIIFAGDLSIRECAELFNRCDIFFSISSGLSNACNTNWCKKDIVWVEAVNSLACSSSPIRSKGKIFWHENDVDKFINMLKKNKI
tara:strand:+ start:863 stop:1909 length:1047 start_codon:yes stop_codon:yes gene_type:complete